MKNLVKSSAFLVFMGTFLFSCEKEKLVFNDSDQNENIISESQELEKSQLSDDYIYIQDNIVIEESQIDLENDNTTLVYDENSHNVYVFDNDEKVLEWAISQNTEFSNSVLESLNKLVLLQKYIAENNIEDYYDQTGSTPEEYDLFFENLFGIGGKSSINILHDQPNASISGSIWAPVSYPKLSTVNFNNKTSAVSIAVSALWLCKNNWYGGSKAFFGALAKTYQNIAFNNVASSIIKL
jgi:hypothetical protein